VRYLHQRAVSPVPRTKSSSRRPRSPLDWHIHEMLYGYLPATSLLARADKVIE
jgi:hypothetical protein